MKFTFNLVMCQDTCELICFKLGMVLNTAKLYSLILVWIDLMFTPGHRVTGKLELADTLLQKLHIATRNMLAVVDCNGEMTVKSC